MQNRHWWFKVHYPAILDMVRPYVKPGMTFLDLGSAAGWSTAGLPAGVSRILLDIRPLALKLARSRNCVRVCGDAHRIPLKDGICDVVICEGLLHQREAHDPGRIAREAVRVCRPGGLVVAAEPAFSCLFGRHDEVFGGCRRFTTEQLMELFSGQPVECLRRTYLHMFAFLPLWIVRRLSKRNATDLSLENPITNAVSLSLGTMERLLFRRLPAPFGVTASLLLRRVSAD